MYSLCCWFPSSFQNFKKKLINGGLCASLDDLKKRRDVMHQMRNPPDKMCTTPGAPQTAARLTV